MAVATIDISQAYTYGITDEAALELIEWRKSIKKPLTQRAFERACREALRCTDLGVTADKAIEIAIDKGWQGVTYEYIKAELQRRGEAGSRQLVIAAPQNEGFIERHTNRDWSH